MLPERPEETDDQTVARYVECGIFMSVEPVGSRVTCDPTPEGTDVDLLCETGNIALFDQMAKSDGFERGGSEIEDDGEVADEEGVSGLRFRSYVRGSLNLIVSEHGEFIRRFLAASSVAKRLNLLNKDDRIALFQAVLYGNRCDKQPTEPPLEVAAIDDHPDLIF